MKTAFTQQYFTKLPLNRFCFKLLLIQLVLVVLTKHSNSQSCQSNQFNNFYFADGSSYGLFADTVSGGGFIFGHTLNYRKSLIKTDVKGNLLWNKIYGYTEADLYSDKGAGKVDKNGNLVIEVNSKGLALLDPSGNVISMKEVVPAQGEENLIIDIFILPDNKKLLFIGHAAYTRGLILLCLSADISTIVWSKYVNIGSQFPKPTLSGNKLYVTTSNGDYGIFMCFDIITGTLLKKSRYKIANSGTYFRAAYEATNGYLISSIYSGAPNYPFNHAVIRLDTNLNVISTVGFNIILDYNTLLLKPKDDGGYYGSFMGGSRFCVSPSDSLLWSRNNSIGWSHTPVFFWEYDDGLVTVAGGNWYNVGIGTETGIGVLKSDKNGFSPCSNVENLTITPINNVTKEDIVVEVRDSSLVTIRNVTPLVNDITYRHSSFCPGLQTCDQLDIEGITSICSNEFITYTGKRNDGCSLPINWQISGGNYEKTIPNDSTINIHFLQTGAYTLIGKLGESCTIADTLEIYVNNSFTVDLGPTDTTLCDGNFIVLSAPIGYVNYLWQNGSTSPVCIASTPGTYYVTATTICGTTFTDTITIHAAPKPDLTIGADRTKCNRDTIHLTATSGFINYSWGNNYNINSLTGQSVIVNPGVDTVYFVKAEKTPGCFAYDTVYITVHNSLPITLGKDTSFCTGNTITLNAGSGFQSYLWNTGNQSQQINISSAGSYSVIATDNNNCSSYDTLSVLNVWTLPVVSIQGNSLICKGTSTQLNATDITGATYLWNNGFSSKNIAVADTGFYIVNVTDINGCRSNASFHVSAFADSPSAFLPMDTVICNYATIQLKSLSNYNFYTWNNGSHNQSIIANNEGVYWLKVTDSNNCTGTDSITIQKNNCLEGLFVPSAFTPNNDGLNDLFKPILLGTIKHFKFVVYNRWGQIIYHTNSPEQGWDGKIFGIPQDTGVFVWVCNYQLEGKSQKTEKGTFTLIR